MAARARALGRRLLWQIAWELEGPGSLDHDDARLHLGSLVAELAPPVAVETEDSWLGKVRDRLRDDFRGRTSVEELARDVDRHPSHLARSFRARFGMTAGECLRRVRIAVAVQLLRRSQLGLSAVAHDSGFADQSHMGRWMRRYVGLTPEEVRLGRARSGEA